MTPYEYSEEWEKERRLASQKKAMSAENELRQQTEQEVMNDENFINSYKEVASYMGIDIEQAPNEEVAKEALQFVSDMMIPLLTYDGKGLAQLFTLGKNAPPNIKKSLHHLISTVDNKETTLNGFLRGMSSVVKDPTTLALPAVGWTFFGRTATQSIMKRLLTDTLVSTAGGMGYGVAEEYSMQQVEDFDGTIPTNWDAVAEQGMFTGAITGFMPFTIKGAKDVVENITAKAVGASLISSQLTTPTALQDGEIEEPITEEPITEEPITEEPITEEPITEEPITEESESQ